eukprot:SAG31_NODE_10284_length_1160_cov_2.010368_1_plen_148_part_00
MYVVDSRLRFLPTTVSGYPTKIKRFFKFEQISGVVMLQPSDFDREVGRAARDEPRAFELLNLVLPALPAYDPTLYRSAGSTCKFKYVVQMNKYNVQFNRKKIKYKSYWCRNSYSCTITVHKFIYRYINLLYSLNLVYVRPYMGYAYL